MKIVIDNPDFPIRQILDLGNLELEGNDYQHLDLIILARRHGLMIAPTSEFQTVPKRERLVIRILKKWSANNYQTFLYETLGYVIFNAEDKKFTGHFYVSGHFTQETDTLAETLKEMLVWNQF